MGVLSMNLAHLVIISDSLLLLPAYPMYLYDLMVKTYCTIIIRIASKETFMSISALWANRFGEWAVTRCVVIIKPY